MSNKERFRGSSEGWEELKGGFVKNNQTKIRFDDERGGGGGRPRNGRPRGKPEVSPPAREETTNNKEIKMTGNTAPAPRPKTMDDREACPKCGWGKPKEIEGRGQDGIFKFRPIVCKGCHDQYAPYVDDATTKLARGEKVVILSRHAWVLTQLDLPLFEQELKEATIEKERLNELVHERINEAAKLQPGGHLSREVFKSLRDKIQMEKLPGEERTARDAYAKWRRLEARLAAARTVRPEVEKMVADEAAKNSPPPPPPAAAVIDTPAPPVAEPVAEVAAPVGVPVVPVKIPAVDGSAKPPAKPRKPKG